MDQIIDKNKNSREKLISILKKNILKIIFLILTLFILFSSFLILNHFEEKKKYLLSEKYIIAGIHLSRDENEKAKKYFEEIVLSGNDFYSLLALNTLIEKNLIEDNEKVIKYFIKLENQDFSKDLADLILLKKALYIMKFKDDNSDKEILENLIKKKSKISHIVEEIISK